MTGTVLRHSVLSLTLLAVLLAAGVGALLLLGAPLWVPVVLAVVVVSAQYAVAPYLIQWLIPARRIAWTGERYDTDLEVGAIVARRCAETGLKPVRLGIVEDGTPNAFTFGHTRGNARIYVTSGLLERLDERELDAVVSHEVGHVKQNDVLAMAIASTVPILLYYVFLSLRGNGNANTAIPAVVSFVGYLLSQLVVLSLGRARELGADHYSCSVTGDGDALCSALVTIGYGMGQVDAQLAAAVQEAKESKDKDQQKVLAKVEGRHQRMRAAGVLGIADQAQGATVLAARERGLDPREVIGALRWDTCNPWARWTQLFSTHPLIVRRIGALEDSGLPGAPTRWSAHEVARSCVGLEVTRARRRFWLELPVRYLPFIAVLVGAVAWGSDDWLLLAQAATVGGVALVVRTAFSRPLAPSRPVSRVTELLTRLDASPVTGLPVEIRGRIIGRGTPGYALSPDLVVQDESGFVPVLYLQPWPFARSLFGLLQAPDLIDTDVVVRGWYRRSPAPVLELREMVPTEGTRVRGFQWIVAYALGLAIAAVGGGAWMFQALSA
ncbi:M48 family metalloprotease [Modestobacter lacusdianchii]